MAKIRIFNVSGRVLNSSTKDGAVRIQVGGTLDLNSPMEIGELMKQQLDRGLLKQRVLDQPAYPAPKSIGGEEKKPADDGVDPHIPDTPEPYAGLKGDALVKAVMVEMIEENDNLGVDGKPNQPVLEKRVQEINERMTVTAERRDRLFETIKPKEE